LSARINFYGADEVGQFCDWCDASQRLHPRHRSWSAPSEGRSLL